MSRSSSKGGWQCRVCGCTDRMACHGGCSWIEVDLCSQCRGKRVRADVSMFASSYVLMMLTGLRCGRSVTKLTIDLGNGKDLEFEIVATKIGSTRIRRATEGFPEFLAGAGKE